MLEKRAADSHKAISYNFKEWSTITPNVDAKYFNHALYNLLDNAIKYGYEGSFIRTKIDVDRKKDILIIEIVSYGIYIEGGDRLYRLFERTDEAAKMAGGTGIGMYIVRKICEAHAGKVYHRSEKLSEYNIPVLVNYKHNQELISSVIERKAEIDGALSSISDVLEKEVVCNNSFVEYSRVFSSRIDKPTFRNSFYVTIPLD